MLPYHLDHTLGHHLVSRHLLSSQLSTKEQKEAESMHSLLKAVVL